MDRNGPSSVNQERAQIGVSPFRDPQEHVLSAARVLPGNEANVGGKLSSALEAKGISHHGHENRGRQDAHAGNGQKPLADRVCLGKLGNPAIKVFPFLVESGELGDYGAERLLEKRGDSRVVRVVHKMVQFVFDLGGRDLQNDPVFGQDTSDMVDRGRPKLDDELLSPVEALKVLSFFCFDRNGRNRRTERCFGDRMRVVPVVLVRPDEGLHILGRNQDHRMPHCLEFPSPEARRPAGFHGDPAGRSVLDGGGKVLAADLLFHDFVPFFVKSHKVKHSDSSGVVEAGCKSIVGGRLKKSSMHWSVAGANAILALRCTIKSGRYESFWERKASQWAARMEACNIILHEQ